MMIPEYFSKDKKNIFENTIGNSHLVEIMSSLH